MKRQSMVSMPGALRGLLIASALAATASAAEPPAELQGLALVEALRAGGHTLYFRHAATDWSQQDSIEQAGDWTSCDPSRLRQLSDSGRETARAIGEAMRALAVPVARVLASPYCRTLETAQLLDLAPVEATEAVINMRVSSYFGGREAVVATAQALLETPPVPDSNTVIVAHGNVARDATPVYPAEAEAVIFRPGPDGGFRFVGRLGPEDWARLAAEGG